MVVSFFIPKGHCYRGVTVVKSLANYWRFGVLRALRFPYSVLSYARYEKGEREPDIATLKTLADYFDVSVDYIIGRK